MIQLQLIFQNINCGKELRSEDKNDILIKPWVKYQTYPARSFILRANNLEYFLPDFIRSIRDIEVFKSQIKGHLFKKHFHIGDDNNVYVYY